MRKAEMKPGCTFSPLGMGCMIVVAIVALLLTVVPGVGRWYIWSTQPASERAEFTRFSTVPMHFPAEWAEPRKPSPRLEADRSRIAAQFKAIERPLVASIAELRGSSPSWVEPTAAETLTTQVAIATLAKPLLQVTSETVAQPDYELSDNFSMYQSFARAAVAQSAVATSHQDWKLALESALLPLRLSQRYPGANVITHLVAISLQRIGARQLGAVTTECTDTLALREALDELNAMTDRIALDVMNPDTVQIVEALGQLREYQALGFPVSLQPGKPLLFYQKQIWRWSRRAYEIQLSKLPFGDPMRAAYENQLKYEKRIHRYLFAILPEWGYLHSRPNFLEAGTRERASSVYIDLVRLSMAQRMEALNGNAATTFPSEMVLKYLPRVPDDRFTSAPYRWSDKLNQFYSAGPDATDDGLVIIYDSTNGTVSKGDIGPPGAM